MECKKEINSKNCPCTYLGCNKKGMCCECLKFHLVNEELPACCFPPDAGKTYDRSFKKFVEIHKED
jgi:hypothetical protein